MGEKHYQTGFRPFYAFIILLLLCLIAGCASPGNTKTTLLLEEIMKEQAPKGEPADSKQLWVPAQIEKRWVPTHYKGNRVYVPGHYEFRVIEHGHWRKK